MPSLLSIVESALHPNFTSLYQQSGFEETKVNSPRKALNLIKKQKFDVIVGEFFYAYSTNYSGVHKSNLDVLILSLMKYSPETRVLALVQKSEKQYSDVLDQLNYPYCQRLVYPVKSEQMKNLLDSFRA